MKLNSVHSSSNGNLAVITGGSKGIGAGLIRQFASKGYHIATYSRNEHLLKELQSEIIEKFSVEFFFRVVDAVNIQQVREFGDYVLQLNKPVKVLINNAGQFLPGELSSESDNNLHHLLTVNLESAYQITRVLLPEMKKINGSHIINICSVASLKAYPQGGSYAISKAALMSFSQNLREELKNCGVKVTAVFPGATLTESWEGSGYPDDRFIPIHDLAKLIWSCHDLSESSVVEEIIIRPQLGDI